MNYPEIMNILEILRRYKTLHSYSNAQMAAALQGYGWIWSENHLNELFIGKARMKDHEEEYFKRFLLQEIYKASTMT